MKQKWFGNQQIIYMSYSKYAVGDYMCFKSLKQFLNILNQFYSQRSKPSMYNCDRTTGCIWNYKYFFENMNKGF